MSILFDNPPPAIGCGDPGDPIDFGVLFTGAAHLSCAVTAANTKQAVIDYNFKDCSSGGVAHLHVSTVLGNNGNYFYVGVNTAGNYAIFHGPGDNILFDLVSVGKLRGKAAHYHPHVRIDTTLPVASDRVQLWLGGRRMILTGTFPVQNADMTFLGGAQTHYIGSWFGTPGSPGGGADVIISRPIYEDSVTPQLANFGYFNAYGHWVHKAYNGPSVYHLPFSNPVDLGADKLDVHNFAPSGLTIESQTRDTPSDNFSILNLHSAPQSGTFSKGLKWTSSVGDYPAKVISSMMLPKSGSRRWKVKLTGSFGSENGATVGLLGRGEVNSARENSAYSEAALWDSRGQVFLDGVSSAAPNFTTGDEIVVVYHADAAQLDLYKLPSNVPSVSISGVPDRDWFAAATDQTAVTQPIYEFDFGQKGFAHEATDEIPYLSSANQSCPDILTPQDYVITRFSTAGAGVTDLPFDPVANGAMVISKDRDSTSHFRVTDTVRGAGKFWSSSDTVAEITAENGLSAFTPTGFDIDPAAAAPWLGTREDLIFRRSPKSGLDILEVDHTTGTPTALPHLAGGMFDAAWLVPVSGGIVRAFYRALAAGSYLGLNSPAVVQTDPDWISGTANTVTIGAQIPTDVYRLILLRSVPQLSYHGIYKGHSSGAFVPLDFSPGPTFLRPVNIADEWRYFNPAREMDNPQSKQLRLNSPDPQSSSLAVLDQFTDGIKFRDNGQGWSQHDQLYVISTWAIQPGKFADER